MFAPLRILTVFSDFASRLPLSSSSMNHSSHTFGRSSSDQLTLSP